MRDPFDLCCSEKVEWFRFWLRHWHLFPSWKGMRRVKMKEFNRCGRNCRPIEIIIYEKTNRKSTNSAMRLTNQLWQSLCVLHRNIFFSFSFSRFCVFISLPEILPINFYARYIKRVMIWPSGENTQPRMCILWKHFISFYSSAMQLTSWQSSKRQRDRFYCSAKKRKDKITP